MGDCPEKNPNESWFTGYWRPAMAWQYFAVCIFDFIIAPVLHEFGQEMAHQTLTQWDPITLHGAAIYHMAMAGIIGVYAYGRSKEKIAQISATVTSNDLNKAQG